MRPFVLFALLIPSLCTAQLQTFSNTTAAACNAWDSGNAFTGFQRTINVTGLPTPLGASGTVLRQVNLQLGTSACKGNLQSYYARIISPSGTIIQLFGPFTTTSTSQWMNVKFRDDIALERVRDYSTTTQQGYHPWSIGYYRTDVANAFSTVNGQDPNGSWTFQLAEGTTSEVSFERVELVFGPPIAVNDVTGATGNDLCAGATCVDGLSVVRGTNNAYPPLDPLYPGDLVGGCAWNGANNNSGWYRFIASGTTAYITVSGMMNTTGTTSADMQLLVVRAPNPVCSGPPTVVPPGGCPDPPTTGNNNSIYAGPNGGVGTVAGVYVNGITANCEFNLSGLVPGQTYYLIIDGNGGLASTFYIEMPSGGVDCNILLPVTWVSGDVECRGGERRIRWSVASQLNNERFEVERSMDALSWATIAIAPGAGSSQATLDYEAVDDLQDLSDPSPVIYYRIKQVDHDGAFSYSAMMASSCSITIYPNPATDHINVVLPFAGAVVDIVDVAGRIVRSASSNGTMARIGIPNLASGHYTVRISKGSYVVGSGIFLKM
jgi:hypothetical protein